MSSSTRPFRIGQAVTMVDRRTGEPVEVVRIAGIGGGEVAVEGYTARFRASDGTGLDTEQVRLVRSAQVIDMAGNTLVPSGDVRVPVRVIAARHDIRPATAADRRATAERREFETLAAELAKHLADAPWAGRTCSRASCWPWLGHWATSGKPIRRRSLAAPDPLAALIRLLKPTRPFALPRSQRERAHIPTWLHDIFDPTTGTVIPGGGSNHAHAADASLACHACLTRRVIVGH